MRIGLIAMSGIRVCDEELLRMGLTLPGFVERSKVIAALPSLGLLTLAGMTPPEHDVAYLEVADLAQCRAAGPIPDDFDLVGISSYSAQIDEAYKLADLYRAQGTPVVLGGLHVSSLPEEGRQHGDAVVVGEGELSWPRVLADAQHGKLQPLYEPEGAEFDLADAPMPAFELLDIDRYNRLTVQTSRGCPHVCEFCASSILVSKRYKQKPLARVLAEIDRIRSLWKRPFIELADDNTFINRAYWRELLPQLRDRHVRWFTETDISLAADPELLTLMRGAGCAQVLIGLESPTQDALDGIEVRGNWKQKQWPHYREAIRTIQSHGIGVNGCFVVGLDGHGPAIFDQIYDFVRETELQEVQITLLTPFPGTPLYDRLRSAGRILEDGAWRTCTLFDVNFQPQHMSPDELREGFRHLGARLYSEEFTRWRRDRFRQTLRCAARAHPEDH
ncbi:MAG: B12-binding domain-containing radical SAM protein [Planctomycetes bacterium]|nr:B12-binding domain-containing radical SAM protein [Planctomycetota bacterium]